MSFSFSLKHHVYHRYAIVKGVKAISSTRNKFFNYLKKEHQISC
jgi:hypothetical protein